MDLEQDQGNQFPPQQVVKTISRKGFPYSSSKKEKSGEEHYKKKNLQIYMRWLNECYEKKTWYPFKRKRKKAYICICLCVYLYVFTYVNFVSEYMFICLYVYIHMPILCVWVRMCVCIYILKQIKPSPHSANTEVYHLAFHRFSGLNWIKDSPGAEFSPCTQGSRWDDLKTMMQVPLVYPCL